jgi:hypothetical protein
MKTTHFDPSEVETKEVVYAKETTQDMYTQDTNADPDGAAARLVHTADYPAYLFDTYRLDDNGNLVPREDIVEKALLYYKTAANSQVPHDDDIENYNSEKDSGIDFLVPFFTSTHVAASGNSARPANGMLYSFAGAANRLIADWCKNCLAYDDICSKTNLSDKQLNFKDTLESSTPYLGRQWRLCRDILLDINATYGTDYEINERQVRAAILNNMTRDAKFNMQRHKPVNVQRNADVAQSEFNDKVKASF